MYADRVNTANVVEYVDSNDPSQGFKFVSLFIRVATTGSEQLAPEQATNYNLGAIWNGMPSRRGSIFGRSTTKA